MTIGHTLLSTSRGFRACPPQNSGRVHAKFTAVLGVALTWRYMFSRDDEANRT